MLRFSEIQIFELLTHLQMSQISIMTLAKLLPPAFTPHLRVGEVAETVKVFLASFAPLREKIIFFMPRQSETWHRQDNHHENHPSPTSN